MVKNTASQKIGAQMVSATDGSAFTGSVTVYVTIDAGTQAVGSVSSGACTHEGEGYHTYAPAQAETNGTLIAFTFKGTGAVPVTVQVFTTGYDPTAAQLPANVTQFGGSNLTASGGRPEVNTTHAAGTAWGSGAITAASIASDAITAAKIADGAIDAATFAAGAINAAAIAADAITDAKVASDVTIASVTGAVGSVTGAVGSVTGNVGGNVTGSVGSVATGGISASSFAAGAIDAAAIAADAIGSSELAASAVTEIQSGLATSSALSSLQTDVATLLGRITSTLFTGITSLAEWLGLIAGKQTGNTTARTEIRATGAGSGTFDETTDSQEALRDNVGTNGAALSLAKTTNITGFNDLSAAQVNTEADTALSDVGLTSTVTGRVDVAVSTRLATAGYTAPLDAAGTRTAIGLASANLDTQLSAIDDYLDTEIAAILAAVDTEVGAIKTVTDQLVAAQSEPSAAPAANATPLAKIAWLAALARNKVIQSATTQTLKADDGTTTIATAAVSDDGSQFERSEWA